MKLLAIAMGLACLSASAQTYEEKVVAAVLVGEAGSEGHRGMSAVAEVIHRRAALTGKTPFQVVTQGKRTHRAFSCMNNLTPPALVQKFRDAPTYGYALAVALQVTREPQKLTMMTHDATHFTRKEERPYWSRGHAPVAVIGSHAFYRLKM